MLQNVADFKDKVILDVGAGTGKSHTHRTPVVHSLVTNVCISNYPQACLVNTLRRQMLLSISAGILSFFAVQAGARQVYAVEASSMAVHCSKLVAANGLSDKIKVIAGKVEEVSVLSLLHLVVAWFTIQHNIATVYIAQNECSWNSNFFLWPFHKNVALYGMLFSDAILCNRCCYVTSYSELA